MPSAPLELDAVKRATERLRGQSQLEVRISGSPGGPGTLVPTYLDGAALEVVLAALPLLIAEVRAARELRTELESRLQSPRYDCPDCDVEVVQAFDEELGGLLTLSSGHDTDDAAHAGYLDVLNGAYHERSEMLKWLRER